jgi:hypothetical protein
LLQVRPFGSTKLNGLGTHARPSQGDARQQDSNPPGCKGPTSNGNQ